jgi:hypothetical protein
LKNPTNGRPADGQTEVLLPSRGAKPREIALDARPFTTERRARDRESGPLAALRDDNRLVGMTVDRSDDDRSTRSHFARAKKSLRKKFKIRILRVDVNGISLAPASPQNKRDVTLGVRSSRGSAGRRRQSETG